MALLRFDHIWGRTRRAPPKPNFGYLLPSDRGALTSVRLQPDVSESDRRDAIGLIRQAIDTVTSRLISAR